MENNGERKMSKAEFVPAVGEQFNSVWKRKLSYAGKDMKFFTKDSHFEHPIALQCGFYGVHGVSKQTDGIDIENFCDGNPNCIGSKEYKNYREMTGYPKDKTLITDSAGFQIASFKKRGEEAPITAIQSLRWQEANATEEHDIAMNLDVPPNLSGKPTHEEFQDALKTSVKNFQFFKENRKNYKMKLYNVLHGESITWLNQWYNAVKDFNFDGWAVGIKPPYNPMLQALGMCYLWEKGELKKDKSYGMHIFGTSGKLVVPTIVYMANKLKQEVINKEINRLKLIHKEKINNETDADKKEKLMKIEITEEDVDESKLEFIRVTYDSSSYNIGSIYRTYYLPFDHGPHLSFGDKFKRVNPHLKELPCKCPVCKTVKDINDLNKVDIYAGTLISLHNMWQYIDYNDVLNSLVGDKDRFIEYLHKVIRSEKTLKSIEFIDYAMEKGVEIAAKKFENWLIPDSMTKSTQAGIYGFT